MSTDRTNIASAAMIARWLIELAEADADVDQEPMTHMRLQKLLYYVQGWSLAQRGKPAFADNIQAWEHGPVVRSLWESLTHLAKAPITSAHLPPANIDADTRAFVASVWEDYRDKSAIELRRLTHAEAPWKSAWSKRKDPNFGNETISHESLTAYFSGLAPKGLRGLTPRKPDPSWLDEPSPFDNLAG